MSEEIIKELNKKIVEWRVLFWNDSEMLAQIQKMNNLIGVSKDSFYGEKPLIKEKPTEIIGSIERILLIKINNIQKTIT